jgi:hypothetical protein
VASGEGTCLDMHHQVVVGECQAFVGDDATCREPL